MEKNKKIIDGHDTNINNLNRVVEENVKSIKEIQENLTITLGKMQRFEQEIKDIHKENVHIHELIEGNSNKIIEEHNNNEENFRRINGSLTEINESIYSLRNNIDKKNKNFDNCIGSMMNSISNLSSKSPNVHQNEENLYKLSMKEIERQQEKLNSFLEEQKQSEDKRNKENDTFKKIIDSLRIDIQNINNKIVNISSKTEEDSEEKKSKDNSLNKIATEEPLEKINEYIKKLTKSISTLPNREEFESLNRNIDARIKKLEELNNIGLRSLKANSKMRRSINVTVNEKIEDNSIDFSQLKNFAEKLKFSITTEINDNFKDMLKKEIKSLDISKNPQIEEIVKTITQHNDEINNNNKTIIDLRKTIFAIEAEKKFNILSS
jgi:chromosome segregation ATPase